MALDTLPVIPNEIGGYIRAQPVIAVGRDGNAASAPRTITVTPTVSATPDYSDGDSVGGLMTVAAIAAADGAPAVLSYVRVISKVAISVAIDLLVFNANPAASTFTDNAGAVVDAADLPKLVGHVRLAGDGWVALSGTQVMQSVASAVPVTGQATSTIYVAAVARGTVNLASTSDLVFRFSATG